MDISTHVPCHKDSSDLRGKLPQRKPPSPIFLAFLALSLGLTSVAGQAVSAGGTVTAEVAPTYLRLEVVGAHK